MSAVPKSAVPMSAEATNDLRHALRTNGSIRTYTDQPVDDATLARILETARFAPSGGNKQGWHVIVLKDPQVRTQIRDLAQMGWNEYVAQNIAGRRPFAADQTRRWPGPGPVDLAEARASHQPSPLLEHLVTAPVVLVVAVDLTVLAAMDAELDRVQLVAGGSVYPFVQNIMLAARLEGIGGVMTTFLVRQEPRAMEVLGLPPHFALASMVALGYPERFPKKLTRREVNEFTTVDRYDGPAFS